ncbi:MAG: hypothetical protein E6441_00850 [Clostridium sp.]|uniref:hypothetical protein n=1 Tax=Clostridium sp. TaxID=1506 RepID=UPI00290802B9|nr:hypothetical protein [Clostridium sp.]MDU5208158.1 hypothetical protein [Clostridium sp.]MDU6759991.1 hypothetical protein [Clostridium sp.]
MGNVMKEKDLDIKNTIKEAVKIAVEEAINGLKDNRLLKNEIPYYKKVELLLYNYENLKEAVKQKEEDIKYLDKYGLQEGSKSIVIYNPSSGRFSSEDRYIELRERYKREKEETERDIKRIESAINKVKNDKYFNILQLKYLNAEEERIKTDELISEKLGKDRTTIIRNRKRLINKLVTILFPESIKDII